jgi:CDP-ribitol ribitolphosphotransferase
LFHSDVRESLGGNLQCVYEAIDDEHFTKVVILKKSRQLKRRTLEKFRLIYYLSVSKFIILDDFSTFVSLIKVRKNQEIVQLWHGPGAFKKFGYSRHDFHNVSKYSTHRNYTKAIVSSEEIIWCYAEGFGMSSEDIHPTGFPRTDVFFDKRYVEETKSSTVESYPFMNTDKKKIIFAPTYRGKSLKHSSYDFSMLDLERLFEALHEDYIFIFKWHPAIYNKMQAGKLNFDISAHPDFFYDLSSERDINDLLLSCDILITDYSSVIFDYVLLDKPIVYFTYDLEEYITKRGLYFPFEDYVYGLVSSDSDSLIRAIKAEDNLKESRDRFMRKFMSGCDGNSTKKTVDVIFGSPWIR